MPSFITHILSGEKTLDNNKDEIIDLVKKHHTAYALGCQGPDLWLFHYALPWQDGQKSKHYDELADLVHEQKVNEVFSSFLNTIVQEKGENRENMIAYVLGHLSHWATDSVCHPYIIYRTNARTPETRYWHIRLESEIDVFSLEKLRQRKYSPMPVYRSVIFDQKVADAVQKLYGTAFTDVFDRKIEENDAAGAMKDCFATIFSTNERTGLLYTVGRFLESRMDAKWKYTSHFIPRRKQKSYDILNLQHKKWYHPHDGKEESELDFWQLLDLAERRGKEVQAIFMDCLKTKDNSALCDYLGNRNYSSGRDGELDYHYFDVIYDNE